MEVGADLVNMNPLLTSMSDIEKEIFELWKEYEPAFAFGNGLEECAGRMFIPTESNIDEMASRIRVALKKAKEKRKKFRVIVTETRPLNQGLATAKELAAAHIETTYIVDSAVSSVMKQVTKVLIGCDAILADGSIVNKIGTYTIALVAEKFQTPVFVAAETLKYDRITVMGTAEPIEERGPEEVTDTKDLKGVKISNPAFDVTPASLISALITEKGIMRPELIREIAQALL